MYTRSAALRFGPLVVAAELAATVAAPMAPLSRVRRLPPPAASGVARRPVLMVHGFMGHVEQLRPLARALHRAGWPQVDRVGYPSIRSSLEDIVERLARAAEPLAHDGPIDVVAHSLGAIAVRAWLKEFDGHLTVRRFVSLCGPHGGTSLYRLVPAAVRPALDPRGVWATRLAAGPEPVPMTVIRSSWDQNIWPPTRGHVPGATEILVHTRGHNGLLWSRRAHQAVIDALS